MKVLVTGVKGQLGYDVMNELAKRGYEGSRRGCRGDGHHRQCSRRKSDDRGSSG